MKLPRSLLKRIRRGIHRRLAMNPVFIHGIHRSPGARGYVHQEGERPSLGFWLFMALAPIAFLVGLVVGFLEKEPPSPADPPQDLTKPITAEEIRARR